MMPRDRDDLPGDPSVSEQRPRRQSPVDGGGALRVRADRTDACRGLDRDGSSARSAAEFLSGVLRAAAVVECGANPVRKRSGRSVGEFPYDPNAVLKATHAQILLNG